ncbi:hypothetical protein E8E14_004200 [Neopestalotiopsis sp. 37M]|nr:hypothetical protein E8E14_004200 [Neopestalotiopsis sp. 37M]
MCKYYAHAFSCKHMSFTFARFCNPASFTQTPCDKRTIWHTIGLEEACDECQIWCPDKCPPPPVVKVRRAGAGGAKMRRAFLRVIFFLGPASQ